MLDRGPVEPGKASSKRSDEAVTPGHFEDPVEEVAVNDAVQPFGREEVPGEDCGGRQLFNIDVQDQVGDDLCGVDQQSVLKKQLIAVRELSAQCATQEVGPKLSLESDGGQDLTVRVEGGESGVVESVRRALSTESISDLVGGRPHRA